MPDVDASVEVPSVDVPSVAGGVDAEGAMPSFDVDVSAPSASLDVPGKLSERFSSDVAVGDSCCVNASAIRTSFAAQFRIDMALILLCLAHEHCFFEPSLTLMR